MAYYITYVSRKGHASIMITEHNPPEKPQILDQVGYGFNQELLKSNVAKLTKKVPVTVNNEELAKQLYMSRRNPGYQITYPISETDLDNVRKKISSDAARSYEEEQGNLDPSYSYLRHNCKCFALELLETAGIDTMNIRNFAFEDPSRDRRNPLLSPIKSSEDRSDLIPPGFHPERYPKEYQEIRSKLNPVNDFIRNVDQGLQDSGDIDNKEYKKLKQKILEDLKKISDEDNDPISIQKAASLSDSITKILDNLKSLSEAGLLTLSKQDELQELVSQLEETKDAMDELQTKASTTAYCWAELPKITQRKDLSSFSDIEKAEYLAFREFQNLNSLISGMTKEIQGSKKPSDSLLRTATLDDLSKILQNNQQTISSLQTEYLEGLKNIKSGHLSKADEREQILKHTATYQNRVVEVRENLSKEVNSIKSKDSLIKNIQIIFNRFIDFITHSNKRLLKVDPALYAEDRLKKSIKPGS